MARRSGFRLTGRWITVALAVGLVTGCIGAAPSLAADGALSTLWVVKADGSVVRSSGLIGLTRLGEGRYVARFAQDVRDCAYTAAVGAAGKKPVFHPGLIFTAGGHRSTDRVYVETKNLAAGLADRPFHLTVTCAGSERAVVDSGGLVRGSARDVIKLGRGRYEVVFGGDVSGCGYRATVADPGSKLVYTPGLVFAAGGHLSTSGVYVETKNLGGVLADFPFHLVVNCAADPDAPDRTSAVVGAYEGLVRGQGARSAQWIGPGRYDVRFNKNVRGCAYTATIADPGPFGSVPVLLPQSVRKPLGRREECAKGSH